jgi:hypothetical protein
MQDEPALAEGRRVVGNSEGLFLGAVHTGKRESIARTPRDCLLGLTSGGKEGRGDGKAGKSGRGLGARTYIMHP